MEAAAIFDQIDAQPPLMRDEFAKTYVGQEVDWMLIFANGGEETSGLAQLIFRIPECILRLVQSTALLSDYPWLKSLRADAPVRVRGKIRGISPLSIELDILDLLVADTFQSGKRRLTP